MTNNVNEIKITEITDKNSSVLNVIKNYQLCIPSYQRGYKWDKGQVKDLLNDLSSFYKDKILDNPGSTDFYCLQSLIIKLDSDSKRYMVIDGQQRLTTCYILLSYLKNKGVDFEFSNKSDCIQYQSRTETGASLRNIYNGIYKEDTVPTCRDQKHIFDAYDEIKDFLDNDDEKRNWITALIKNDAVRFILQELPSNSETSKEIESFEDVNTGRISLTDAELIRANLILKASDTDEEKIKIEISSKWDEIERSLQDDLFWFFIQNEKNNEDKVASRIEYLFDILANDVNNQLEEQNQSQNTNKKSGKKGKDDNTILDEYKKLNKNRYIYRFFKDYRYSIEDSSKVEQGNTFEDSESINIFWEKVKSLYEIFIKWYSDVELYNYIGIVLYNYPKSIYRLYTQYLKSNRKEFIIELKKQILRSFVKKTVSINEIWNIDAEEKNVRTKKIEELNPKDKTIVKEYSDVIKNKEYYDYSDNFNFKTLWYDGRAAKGEYKQGVMSFLLWSNCQYLNLQLKNTIRTIDERESIYITQEPYRFPFDIFKTRNADIEHVTSYNSKEDSDKIIKDDNEKYEWILNVLAELSDGDKNTIIENIKEGNCDFDEFRNEIYKKFGDDISLEADITNLQSKEIDRRRIGNLTLLDENINRGYGNDPFRLKRKDIIQKSTQGIYVYPCTKLVFLKEFDVKAVDLTSWKEEDFKKYTQFLADMFYECFCVNDMGDYTSDILEAAENDRKEDK